MVVRRRAGRSRRRRSSSSSSNRRNGRTSIFLIVVLVVMVVTTGCFLALNAALLVAWWPHDIDTRSTSTWLLPPSLKDSNDSNDNNHSNTNYGGKERVLQILRDAGVSESFLQQHGDELPAWETVAQQYGEQPVVFGLETACPAFRRAVPAVHRMLGAAGMFSTGTNLVTQLLKQNCVVPERAALYGASATKEQLGMRWQVPWGKHTPQHYRQQHSTEHARDIRKHDILPIITIRNPWRWMQSMCKNPYTARWPHRSQCPNLKIRNDNDAARWNEVTVKYGAATETYQSLAHLWNEWYNDYYRTAVAFLDNTTTTASANENNNSQQQQQQQQQQQYPWIMIRMEDLIFHTVSTITQVCECAGGQIRNDRPFHYIVDSAKKDSPGHDTTTGAAEAWIKYSRPLPPRAGFTPGDHAAAREALDPHLMQLFGYRHPPE